MNKTLRISAAALLITGLLTLSACQWQPEEPPAPPPDPPPQAGPAESEVEPPPPEEGILSWEQQSSSTGLSDTDNNIYSQISINGLVFSGNSAAERINSDLLAEEDQYLYELADEEGAMYAADPSLSFTHELSYRLAHYDQALLSVVRDSYAYQQGAAHPQLQRQAYNYDPMSGQRLGIEQIMGADWQESMVSAIYQQINEAGELGNYYPNLDKLLLSEFRADQWWADGNNVYVIYQPYQIAPYAVGLLEFAIAR